MNHKEYTPTIGLEIHAELKTQSKMFCSCRNDPEEIRANANVCPICLGHPGTLPVINIEAVRNVLKFGAAISGTRADFTEWDRKNYFYPDIPKGYQISQYKFPLIRGGMLGGVAIERVHLEEDTARSTHDQHKNSLLDFNRSGVPLMELVTMPVIHDAATAVRFAKELQLLLRYLAAGEANMEKGELRVEANISVASHDDSASGKFGTKTEVKNLNSFRSVEKAITYEIARQSSLLVNGETVLQETRGWDDKLGETFSQRGKESSHDYRYFPDPDIPKAVLSEMTSFSGDSLAKSLPELPWVKRERFKREFAMTDKEVEIFVRAELPLADYYENVVGPYRDDMARVKLTTNYITNDYLYGIYFDEETGTGGLGDEFNIHRISSSSFSELINLIADGTISSRGAKDLIMIALKENSGPKDSFKDSFKDLAEKHGLLQKNDDSDLMPVVEKTIAENAPAVAEYKKGKIASLQYLIGQVMKASKGAANPSKAKELLVRKLSK